MCDSKLAQWLKSGIWEISPLPSHSSFCSSKDNTWCSQLASADVFILFFSPLCPIWVFGRTGWGLKAVFQLSPPCPLLPNYLKISPAWQGFLSFLFCILQWAPVSTKNWALGTSCQWLSWVIEHLSPGLKSCGWWMTSCPWIDLRVIELMEPLGGNLGTKPRNLWVTPVFNIALAGEVLYIGGIPIKIE